MGKAGTWTLLHTGAQEPGLAGFSLTQDTGQHCTRVLLLIAVIPTCTMGDP